MRIAQIKYRLASKTETIQDLKTLNPDWQIDNIYEKVGIKKRHILASGETAMSLGLDAAQALLQEVKPQSIQSLIYVTQSPESLIPSTACVLHEALSLPQDCMTLDIVQGCSGFVYALQVATSMIDSGSIDRCLIICSETYTKYISRHDKTCRPIFSDGACAVLVERSDSGSIGPFQFITEGSGASSLMLESNGHSQDVPGPILRMNGRTVFFFTMNAVPKAVDALLRKAELRKDDIDLFVFHQASKVVLDHIQKALEIKPEKFLRNYQNIGNTVSATIPIALKQARESGSLRPGMIVMLMGFGVGYSLAGCILRTGRA